MNPDRSHAVDSDLIVQATKATNSDEEPHDEESQLLLARGYDARLRVLRKWGVVGSSLADSWSPRQELPIPAQTQQL